MGALNKKKKGCEREEEEEEEEEEKKKEMKSKGARGSGRINTHPHVLISQLIDFYEKPDFSMKKKRDFA